MVVVRDQTRETLVEADCPVVSGFQISHNENEVVLTFESTLEQSASDISGSGVKKRCLTHKNFQKLPHDLVCAFLGFQDSDRRLEVIECCRNPTDRLTPDIITKDAVKGWVVIEVKTSRTTTSLTNLAERALEKYYEPVKQRATGQNILLGVLAVSPHRVCTNLDLNYDQMVHAQRHYLLGLRLLAEAENEGWLPPIDEEELEISEKLQESLNTISMPESMTDVHGVDDPLYITSDMVADWRRIPEIDVRKIFLENCPDASQKFKDNLSSEGNCDKTKSGFDSFWSKVDATGTKSTPDTILHYPIADVKCDIYDPNWPAMLDIYMTDLNLDLPYGRLWKQAFEECSSNVRKFWDVSVKDMLDHALEEKEAPKLDLSSSEKSKHFTVQLDLSENDRIELALRGVQGKSMKDYYLVKQHQKLSRETYNRNTDVSDISKSFEEGLRMLKNRSRDLLPTEIRVRSLVERARRLSGAGKNLAEDIYRNLMRTKLFGYLDFMDQVVAEVNITRLKFLKKDVFVLKKLPSYAAYLLIKTTSADGKVFVSVSVPQSHFMNSFPLSERWMDIGGMMCTKFVALDRHKITQKLYTTQKAACLYMFWCHQAMIMPEAGSTKLKHSDRATTGEVSEEEERMFPHFWISLLVLLEDKEKTSTALQLVRYAYMEVVKGGPLRPMPEKICKKLDHKIRSRLLLWCLRSITEVFIEMTVNPPIIGRKMTFEEEDFSQDEAKNLLSWVTKMPVGKYEECLNLSYLGVLHNKEEEEQKHGYLKIFDKVISQELLLDKARIHHMTIGEELKASELRDHEFSAKAVKTFACVVKSLWQARFGVYKTWATKVIMNALSKKTLLDMATTKSSTLPDLQDLEETDPDRMKQMPNLKERVKCMENVKWAIEHVGLDSNDVYSSMPKVLEYLETNGGLKASLFKKLQIGGTREIFVLDIMSRIAISFLETVSRSLCENLTCEMLTKGDAKVTRSDNHFASKRVVCKGLNSATLISSDDAATWAQRFVMPVFGVMLNELVPDPMLAPCLRVLNIVTSKRLILPLDLTNLFLKHKEISSPLHSMNVLKEEFLSDCVDRQLLDRTGSRFMKNRSNMMQGILHYTSSLLHACYMTSYVVFIRHLVKTHMLPGITAGIATAKVSSDDSSLILTLGSPLKGKDMSMKLIKAGTLLCLLKSVCYPLICARQSDEKSTVANAQLIEEFNSLWFYRNTLISPTIKFVSQVARTHVTDRFETRQDVMAGLRSQVYESSGSTLLASFCQSAQARCHYLSLGLITHKLFGHLEMLILEKSHPSLGFFLYEHPLLCGMFGQNLALYQACRSDIVVNRLTNKLSVSSSLTMLQEDAGMCRLALTQGSTTRYNAMLKRMKVSYEDELRYFDDNPYVLLRYPCNTEELCHLLYLRAATPSVANSFEFLTDSKLHAASAYALHAKCVTLTERTVSRDATQKAVLSSEINVRKVSLLKAIDDLSSLSIKDLSPQSVSWIFPNKEVYDEILANAKIVEQHYVSRMTRLHKNRYIIHSVPKYDYRFTVRPADACADRWFSLNKPGTRYEKEQTWQTLKTLIPWLRENFVDTLLGSPQQTAVGVISFIKQIETSSSSIRVIAPCSVKSSIIENVTQLMRRSFYPSRYLVLPDRPETTDINSDEEAMDLEENEGELRGVQKPAATALARKAQTALWLSNEYFGDRLTARMVRIILGDLPDIVEHKNRDKTMPWSTLTTMDARLAVFQQVVKHNVTDVGNMITKAKRGLKGMFTTRGTFNASSMKYEGFATYQGTFNGVPFVAQMDGETLQHITLRSSSDVSKFSHGVNELTRDLRCTKMPTTAAPDVEQYLDMESRRLGFRPGSTKVPLRFNPELRVSNDRCRVILQVDKVGVMRLVKIDNRDIELFEQDPRAYYKRVTRGLEVYKGKCTDIFEASREDLEFAEKLRGSTVLTWSPFPPREVTPYSGSIRVSAFKDWLENVPMALDLAKEMIKEEILYLKLAREEGREDDYVSETKSINFVRDTLKARAYFNQLIYDYAGDLAKQAEIVSEEITQAIPSEELVTLETKDIFDLAEFMEMGDDVTEGTEWLSDFIDTAMAEEVDPSDFGATFDDLGACAEGDAMKFFRPSLTQARQYKHMGIPVLKFWDNFLEAVVLNSSTEVRSLAFKGAYRRGASEAITLLAELFGAQGPMQEAPTAKDFPALLKRDHALGSTDSLDDSHLGAVGGTEPNSEATSLEWDSFVPLYPDHDDSATDASVDATMSAEKQQAHKRLEQERSPKAAKKGRRKRKKAKRKDWGSD